jgi:subtilisin family serine protease
MKKQLIPLVLASCVIFARPSAAQNVIVHDTGGLSALTNSCLIVGCTVQYGLDGSVGQTFLVTPNACSGLLNCLLDTTFSLVNFIADLLLQPGVTNAEPDQLLGLTSNFGTLTSPSGLWNTTSVKYYGTTVWAGYTQQPPVYVINLPEEQSSYRKVTGSGIVAVIDTGIDPTHPAFQGVLVTGYDFTRNTSGGSETGDVNQSTMAVVDGSAYPVQVNQSTMAVVDGNEALTLEQSQYAAFGHGTMTSGVVHLVAPTAKIMPLKAFQANGTAKLSDVIRAVYYAVQNHANVISMSFDFPTYSKEMNTAVGKATGAGLILVASAGNDGKDELVYPAALTTYVMGVASTNDLDQQSSFTNYGDNLVWVAAPGEAIIGPYPGNTYAAGWGTSFSAPFVAGEAALVRSAVSSANQTTAAQAIAHAKYINSNLNKGRIDVYQAIYSVE